MSLNIKNPEARRLAKELAERTGESLTKAVIVALRERLSGLRRQAQPGGLMAAVAEIQDFVGALPDRDCRSADEILGYDDHGLPS